MELKQIKKPNTDYIQGVLILNKYMTENTSVNSNELTYWIDNYNKMFDDKLYCYVIKNNKEVVGYFQFVHFKDEFIFIDFLVIEKEHRSKEIYSLIEEEFKKLKCDTIIVESGNELNQHGAIIRLYEMMGFKQFNIDYVEPKINVELYNQTFNWISVESTLMYRGELGMSLGEILRTIYVKHYARWYRLYDFDLTDYMKFLDELIEKHKNDYIKNMITKKGVDKVRSVIDTNFIMKNISSTK